jgi:hypothetical protein
MMVISLVFASSRQFDKASAVELLLNGSFEDDGFATRPLLTGWDDAPAGTNNRGFRVGDYPFLFGGEIQGIDAGALFEFPTDMPSAFTAHPAQ